MTTSKPIRAQDLHSATASLVDDRALVARIRAGDGAAFETLFRAYYAPLCNFVVRYVQSRAEAEDLVHDVFLGLWERRAEWEVRADLRTYLFGAARNRALNALKRAHVERRWHQDQLEAAALDSVDEPARGSTVNEAEARLAAEEIDAAIGRAIATLPERCRAALALRWRQQMSYAEIANTMGIAVKTVEIYIARGSKALRAAHADLEALRD